MPLLPLLPLEREGVGTETGTIAPTRPRNGKVSTVHDPNHEPEHDQERLPYAEGELVGPDEDREPDPSEQVRLWTTEKLQEMIASLEPYTNGTLGEISPRHATARLAMIRELNRVWQAHVIPEPEHERDAEHQAELERVQEEVAAQVRAEVEQEREEALRAAQEEQERLALEQAARAKERVLEGISELRRRAPGTS